MTDDVFCNFDQDDMSDLNQDAIVCPDCLAALPDKGWKHCPECGANLSTEFEFPETLPENPSCRQCGEKLLPHWRICPSCGTALGANTPQGPRAPNRSRVAHPPANFTPKPPPAIDPLDRAADMLDAGQYHDVIQALDKALRAMPTGSRAYGQAHNLLGCAYRGLLESTHSDSHLSSTIQHFKEALTVFTPDAHPEMFCSASYNLAAMYGYADLKALDLDDVMPHFEAWHLMQHMLPVAQRIQHPKLGMYTALYEHLQSRF